MSQGAKLLTGHVNVKVAIIKKRSAMARKKCYFVTMMDLYTSVALFGRNWTNLWFQVGPQPIYSLHLAPSTYSENSCRLFSGRKFKTVKEVIPEVKPEFDGPHVDDLQRCSMHLMSNT